MEFIKKYYKYFILFIIIFLCNIFFRAAFYDSAVQYGMSHAIRIGEIPYRDFNTITTPLFILICSLPLFIFDDYIVFIIFNSLLTVLIYYYADQIIKYHKITFVLATLIPFCDILCPSYNLLAKLLIVLLIYFEKNEKNDIWIGILLGLTILSKHSIGFIITLMSLIYAFVNHKKMLCRIGGVMIPSSIFFLYLLITKSLLPFIDLCFLGLKNFQNDNAYHNWLLEVILLLTVILVIKKLVKDKSNSLPYYVLGSIAFVIPMCDSNHFASYLLFFYLFLFSEYDIKLNYVLFNIFLVVLLIVLNFGAKHYDFEKLRFSHYPHFGILTIFEPKKDMNFLLEKYSQYNPSILVSPNSMIYDTILEKRITYFDVPLRGNFGHLGTEKMIQSLEKGTYYFIDENPFNHQFDDDLCTYIKKNSTFIEKVNQFSVYYYE